LQANRSECECKTLVAAGLLIKGQKITRLVLRPASKLGSELGLIRLATPCVLDEQMIRYAFVAWLG
jgi:hypothetical protein